MKIIEIALGIILAQGTTAFLNALWKEYHDRD